MKVYTLKCFWDHKRTYFVLVEGANGWDWINLGTGNSFSSGHPTEEDAINYAKDQGIVKGISLEHLYPNINGLEGAELTSLAGTLGDKLNKKSRYMLNEKEMKLIVEIIREL